MTPAITGEQAVLAVLGAYLAVLLCWLGIGAVAAWRAARRRVIGKRVPKPQWRARQLRNGEWVVDRVREGRA